MVHDGLEVANISLLIFLQKQYSPSVQLVPTTSKVCDLYNFFYIRERWSPFGIQKIQSTLFVV